MERWSIIEHKWVFRYRCHCVIVDVKDDNRDRMSGQFTSIRIRPFRPSLVRNHHNHQVRDGQFRLSQIHFRSHLLIKTSMERTFLELVVQKKKLTIDGSTSQPTEAQTMSVAAIAQAVANSEATQSANSTKTRTNETRYWVQSTHSETIATPDLGAYVGHTGEQHDGNQELVHLENWNVCDFSLQE